MNRSRQSSPDVFPGSAREAFAWWRDPLCVLLLLAGLAVRIAYASRMQGIEPSDPLEYDAIGWNVAQGIGFTNRGFADPESWVRHAPMYPLFLGAVYFIFGHDLHAARIAQSIVGTILAAFTCGLASRVARPPVVRAVAALAAVYPYLVYYSGYLMSETLSSCFFYASLYAATSGSLRASGGILGGALLGLAGLTRPSFLGFAPLLALWLWWSARFAARSALLVAAFVLGLVLTVSPWTLRNYRITGTFVPIQTSSVWGFFQDHLWFSQDDFPTFDFSDEDDSYRRYEERHQDLFLKYKQLPDAERDRYFRDEAIRYVVSDPVRYLRSCFRKFVWLWRPSSRARVGSSEAWDSAFWVSILTYAVWLPAFVFGLFRLWRRADAGRLLVGFVLFVTAFHTFYWCGTPRYRFPIYPVFLIACSVAVEEWIARMRRRE